MALKAKQRRARRRESRRALERAMDLLESHEEALEGLALDVVTGFLGRWESDCEEEALAYLDARASPRELLASMSEGTAALACETERCARRRRALVDLARSLGKVGVRLLVGALLAA